MPDKWRDSALELIGDQSTLTLATADASGPWSAPVYFVFIDGRFYFFSSPESRHIQQAVLTGQVAELAGYAEVRSEVRMGARSRVDLMLQDDKRGSCHVEIKNCTMVKNGRAYFPDAVTTRGLKHLHELAARVSKRNRSVMFYLIQRMDAEEFRPADHIDPAYGKGLRQAVAQGVEILAYDVHIDRRGIRLNQRRPCRL